MVPKAKKLKVLKINVYLKIKNIKSTVAHILPPPPPPPYNGTYFGQKHPTTCQIQIIIPTPTPQMGERWRGGGLSAKIFTVEKSNS